MLSAVLLCLYGADLVRGARVKSYVSRPDIAAPLFNITLYSSVKTSPGYWLFAPYYDAPDEDDVSVKNDEFDSEPRVPVGPYIFRSDGELVWSGSPLQAWQHIDDFKPSQWGEFSFLVDGMLKGDVPSFATPFTLNSSLQLDRQVALPTANFTVDPHEFQLAENGDTYIVKVSHVHPSIRYEGRNVVEDQVYEINRRTGDIIFEWRSLDHIPISESSILDTPYAKESPINYLHVNAIDKTPNGDYLVSGRHADTIYLISGEDGSIKWRFGGHLSSFTSTEFNFSAQHDARYLPSKYPNTTLISFLDNASNGFIATEQRSSGVIVALDHQTNTASLMARFPRPDGGISDRRGNVQVLEDGNTFVCWSEHGYISEFSSSGDLLLDARFKDQSLATYRAFKMNTPLRLPFQSLEAPVLVVHAAEKDQHQTVVEPGFEVSTYVSWNGAVDISRWRIYSRAHVMDRGDSTNTELTREREDTEWVLLADAPTQGFETPIKFTLDTTAYSLYAEAIDESGLVVGRTAEETLPSLKAQATAKVNKEIVQPNSWSLVVMLAVGLPATAFLGLVAFILTVKLRSPRHRRTTEAMYKELKQYEI